MINNDAAKIIVHGNAAPTPSGAIATKNKIAPIQPVLNIHPFNNIEIAMSAWQTAMKTTTIVIWLLNYPRMNCSYIFNKLRSA